MQCFIYRSSLQDEMYLYLGRKDDFAAVPEALIKRFGRAEFVMALDLASRERLARVELAAVKTALASQGYFLQMPPTIANVLHDGD
jgi:uncharacterized protein YcgL (UPF0745 family)